MKKVLFITYTFPPVGGVGVQRNLKFIKNLPELGWKSVVLTMKPDFFFLRDNQLANDIPQNTKIFRTNCIKPKQKKISWTKLNTRNNNILLTYIYSFIRFIENTFFIIDIWIGWIPFALFTGYKISKNENIDVIISSGPSFTSFLIGYLISKKSKLPLILDYRDGWTIDARRKTSKLYIFKNIIDRFIEIIILKYSTKIIFVSKELLQLYSKTFKYIEHKSQVITNGFDKEDFIFDSNHQFKDNNSFIISHIGNCNIEERKPVLYAFLKAIKNINKIGANLKINLIGTVPEDVRKTIREYNLRHNVKIIDFLPHYKAIDFMTKSDILLLLIENSPLNKTLFSGKLFEYLGANKPIVCFGPRDGAAGKAILEAQAGIVIDYKKESIEEMTNKLSFFIENIINNNFHIGNPDAIKKYERKVLTKKLANILDSSIGARHLNREP